MPLAAKRILRADAHTHFFGPRAEGQREEKITPVWPCEPLCALFPERAVSTQAPPYLFGASLGLISGICGGRKKKQDKGQASKLPLCPVKTARSAGSYGEFPVYQKWGQKHDAGITIGVIFPECLETRAKSRSHPGDMHGFLRFCLVAPAEAPPQKLRRRKQS